MLHLLLNVAVFAVVYALADRFAGGGAPKLDDQLPGRAAFWGFVACALVGFLLASWGGVCMAIAWFAWRTPPWGLIPGSSTTPVGATEVLATAVRHGLVVPLAAFAAHITGHHTGNALYAFTIWTVFATSLAGAYGSWKVWASTETDPGPGPDAMIELARGWGFGLAVACVLA